MQFHSAKERSLFSRALAKTENESVNEHSFGVRQFDRLTGTFWYGAARYIRSSAA